METLKNQLIIVEGLTGLGKSTLAHFLARQFEYNGIDACWIHEGEDPHPVDVDVGDDIETFMDQSLQKWGGFVDQIRESGRITIIEASFFNNLIETLFAHCLDQATIIDFSLKMQEVIQPARPALVYLRHPDISLALKENFRNRGEGFRDFVIDLVARMPIAKEKGWNDYAGMEQFWREFVAIIDTLFEIYEMDKLAIDISRGDWDTTHQQVTAFLGLSLVADPLFQFDEAEKYLGAYQFTEGGKVSTIRYQDGFLQTNAFLNVYTKLIPREEGAFLAEKWHFSLHFESDPDTGDATAFTIGGRDVNYLKAVGMSARKVSS